VMQKTFGLKAAILSLLALLLVSGCGYHPVAVRSPLDEANGVNVTLFVNKSYHPGVEGVLARDLVDELALRSGGKVLSGDQAQLELAGVVLSYNTLPVSYTSQDTIKEYRTAIGVQAVLREKQNQKVLWKGDLSESQTFPVNPNLALQQNAEEAATQKICRRLAELIWQKIGERF
jgi:outer membrane lipopolysaccharide assembly protein LptE/RlpB